MERMTAEALLHAFEPPLRPEMLLRVEVNVHLPENNDDATLNIALRIGQERLYVIRNLSAFLRAMSGGETIAFGKGFTYDPSSMRFSQVDQKLFMLLSEIEAAQRPYELQGCQLRQNGKFMPVGEQAALRLLRLLRAKAYRLVIGKNIIPCEPIQRVWLDMHCHLEEQSTGLVMTIGIPKSVRLIAAGAEFIRQDLSIVQLPYVQQRILYALLPHLYGAKTLFHFAREETERVISEILPQLEEACHVTLSDSLRPRICRKPLVVKTYIDREGDRVTVRVAFQYGERVIDPFSHIDSTEGDGMLLVRDTVREHEVLETLAHAGFHVSAGKIYLSDAHNILHFVQEGVKTLQNVSEVYASEHFKRMRPRRPSLTGRLASVGGMLQLYLYDEDVPMEDVLPLMQALRDQKRYFRLKDGGFLDLSGMEQWHELAELVGDAGEMDSMHAADLAGHTAMPLQNYRSAYLVSLLAASDLPVAIESEVQKTADALHSPGEACPKELDGILRGYQIRGFEWIQALHRLNMGGILADDMGLGKTLQVISAIVWSKERDGVIPSLVIAPTSLIYNWQAEVRRFAPSLSSVVIEGNQHARALRWEEIKTQYDVDVVITSYPLLRRDIQSMEDIPFRYIVLDEAQHIKNPQSLSAESAGRLQGQTRLALTGTPMENNPGELWSIFHFVLPGYLLTLPQFMRRYGDGGGVESLRRRIRPFLLRRLKADVLPELPDKIETSILADMPAAQRNVYAAAVLRLRERVETVLENKGLQRGRMEVLSAITQLRQICCHPALVIKDYDGSSGKMDALSEILVDALGLGHRILLFSQFTSMLFILRRSLDASGIQSIYLDGKTPVAQRMELVNRFNGGEGQVFLISLKAGGAGLNLTGADMVIHYDPWWNPAAEDQATDRAHRIGQKQVVQVIRLITRASIEEQVVQLSKRKRALFDAIITAGEQLPTDLTKEDILGFFT